MTGGSGLWSTGALSSGEGGVNHHEYVPAGSDDQSVHAAAAKALELVSDGARVGLGSGRAV
jgi:hypothetical protein